MVGGMQLTKIQWVEGAWSMPPLQILAMSSKTSVLGSLVRAARLPGSSSSAAGCCSRGISTTIFIKGLPPECNTALLREELEPHFGAIRYAVIFQQPESIKKANAMVDFHEIDSALAAQDELDQSFFLDRRVDVEFPRKERDKSKNNRNRQQSDRMPHQQYSNKPYRRKYEQPNSSS